MTDATDWQTDGGGLLREASRSTPRGGQLSRHDVSHAPRQDKSNSDWSPSRPAHADAARHPFELTTIPDREPLRRVCDMARANREARELTGATGHHRGCGTANNGPRFAKWDVGLSGNTVSFTAGTLPGNTTGAAALLSATLRSAIGRRG